MVPKCSPRVVSQSILSKTTTKRVIKQTLKITAVDDPNNREEEEEEEEEEINDSSLATPTIEKVVEVEGPSQTSPQEQVNDTIESTLLEMESPQPQQQKIRKIRKKRRRRKGGFEAGYQSTQAWESRPRP